MKTKNKKIKKLPIELVLLLVKLSQVVHVCVPPKSKRGFSELDGETSDLEPTVKMSHIAGSLDTLDTIEYLQHHLDIQCFQDTNGSQHLYGKAKRPLSQVHEGQWYELNDAMVGCQLTSTKLTIAEPVSVSKRRCLYLNEFPSNTLVVKRARQKLSMNTTRLMVWLGCKPVG